MAMDITSKKSFRVNTILNVSKQICAIFFPFFTFSYASRVLGSDAYGQYSYSFSIVSYFILIANFGVNTYAVREGARIRENKDELNHFCNQVFSINTFFSIISLLSLLLLCFFNKKIMNYRLIIIIQSLQIVFFLIGADWINSIFEDYIYLTIRYIIIQIMGLVSIFLFIKSPDDVFIYSLIVVFTTSGGNLFNIIHVRKYVHLSLVKKCCLRKHFIPMLILFVNNFSTLIYVNADITMLGHYYDDSIVGVYSFSSKIYSVVKSLINAVIIVAIPRLSFVLEKDKDNYNNYLIGILNTLITFMLPIVVGLLMLSNQVILLMGGVDYSTGNGVLRVLCPAILFALTGSFFVNCILIVQKREKIVLLATSVSAVVNFLLNLYMIPHFSIIGAAITTLVSEIIACVIEGYYARLGFIIQLNEISDMKSSIIGSFIVSLYCFGMLIVLKEPYLQLLFAILPSIVIYYLICVYLKNSVMLRINRIIKSLVKNICNLTI